MEAQLALVKELRVPPPMPLDDESDGNPTAATTLVESLRESHHPTSPSRCVVMCKKITPHIKRAVGLPALRGPAALSCLALLCAARLVHYSISKQTVYVFLSKFLHTHHG